MPPDAAQPEPPALTRPSVFLSYSSEDRAAARRLRDALLEAGLDVWYDESELGGGDSWDQKIRRQIRECRYFVPVVSASTNRRSEGYFRREWRLAVERTLDMADDVLFLVPVVIDDTRETDARVPEKFLTVQWLRVPGGQPGPALAALARKLTAGEPAPASRPPQPGAPRTKSAPADHPDHLPPPMPAFPHKNPDHPLRYYAEVLWWVVTAAWTVIRRLPRWVRILLLLWIIFGGVFRCSNSDEDKPARTKPETPEVKTTLKKEDVKKAVSEVVRQLDQSGKGDSAMSDLVKAGAKIANKMADEMDDKAAAIGVVPFPSTADAAEAELLKGVHDTLFGQLAQARPGQVKPLAADPAGADAALTAQAAVDKVGLVLAARLSKSDDEDILSVRLLSVETGATLWTGHFPLAGAESADIARKISQGVLAVGSAP